MTNLASLKLASGEIISMHTGFTPASGWQAHPGVYLFVRPYGRQWEILYVGRAENLQSRFSDHHKWSAATGLGATEIHAVVVADERERARLESEIYYSYMPMLNEVAPARVTGMLGLGRRRSIMEALNMPGQYTQQQPRLSDQIPGLGLRRPGLLG